jgi:hypothetical protein
MENTLDFDETRVLTFFLCPNPSKENEITSVHRGERIYSSYSFTSSALDGTSSQRHAPAALYPRRNDPPVPIRQEIGWAPEPVWTRRLQEKSSLPSPGIELLLPGRPVRRQILYCLSYRGSSPKCICEKFYLFLPQYFYAQPIFTKFIIFQIKPINYYSYVKIESELLLKTKNLMLYWVIILLHAETIFASSLLFLLLGCYCV